MASDKILLHDPQWTDEDIKWYISSKPVKRILGKSGNAPAGTIFEVDYEYSKLNEKQKKEIVLKSCHKGTWKVKWAPLTFYGLDDDSKNLLLALSDQNDRLRFYLASRQTIEYGKTLKAGDDVCVRLPKKKEILVGGVIKYIGPVEEECSGIWFGVELLGNCGDSDGVFKKTGDRYFTCEQGRGIFVTIKNIRPTSVSEEEKQKLSANFKADVDASDRSSHAANNVGLGDIPQTSYIRAGDKVTLFIQTERGGQSKQAVGHVALVHDGHVAVNVLESEAHVFKPWNGYHNHKKIYDANKQTVWQKLDDVKLRHSPSSPAPYGDKKDKFSQNMPQENVGQRREDGASVSAVTATCRNEMKMNIQETKNIRMTREVTVSQPQSLGTCSMASDVSMSDSRVSSSSSVEMSQKNIERVTRSHSFDASDKYSAGMNSKSQESKANKLLKNVMSNISSFSSSFSRGAPPEFPLKDFHIDELSKDRNFVENLVTELDLIEKWRDICRHEQRNYFRVEFLLKWWWFNHIREGHKEELKRFTDLLAKLGREDLRDHINEVPDCGTFDKTVVVALVRLVDAKWPILVKELALKQQEVSERITTYMKTYECIQSTLEIWQEKEPGCKKLHQLVDACRAMELTHLADDIEQGLSEKVLRRIARRIERFYFDTLGGHLKLSGVRLDAFKRKFYFLSDGVFNMLCWWSMRQPLNVDKAENLYDALKASDLEKIAAEELSRGIQNDDLEATALLIKDHWKSLAPYLVSKWDINDLVTRYEDDVEKALNMLCIWKRRQPFDGVDLKETLYDHLIDCEMYKAARLLYDGLDHGTLTHLSRKICFEWSLLAHHFGFDGEEISKRLAGSNQAEMSLILLKECVHTKKVTKADLFKGLKAIGREDLVQWMHRRAEEDTEEELPKSKLEKSDVTAQPRKLDRIVMEEVVSAIRSHVDANNFMSILNLKEEDVSKFLPKSVRKSEVKTHFAILCSWKKKQLSEGRGDSECFKLLRKILTLYEQHTAAAALNIEGSSVDPEWFGSPEGAAGGVSSPVHQDLNVYSMVEVSWGGKILPGVIQWIGVIKGLEEHGKIAGVELEELTEVGGTSGKFGDTRYFDCQYGRGLFAPLNRCRPDSRFLTETETYTQKEKMGKEDFGNIECDPVEGYVEPSKTVKPEYIGMFKGIQGDHNSCYMDVTLYSMFAFSDIFDAILHYESTAKTETKNVKDALRETIVNPLRSIGVVRADHVLRFRDSLSCLSSMEGFRTEEKDPEEFIHALLQELLNAKPFLKISQGTSATMESFVYQIFTDKKKYLDIPTVGDLLHVSFLESDLKLSEVPECFIVQLPRYGKKYKLYDWIIPSLEIDINLLIRDSPRPCSACGELAFMECRDCTPEYEDDEIIQSFCGNCFPTVHSQKSKQQHQSKSLTIAGQFVARYKQTASGVDDDKIASETYHLYEKKPMELFSVVCIETSHYVAFVKTGSGEHAQWVFFDSMADRRGDQHGYNVPEVSHLRDFEEQMRREDLKDALKRKEELPKYLKRLLSDAYICFYRPIKSGGGNFPRGRTRRSVEEGRGQNIPALQREALSVEKYLSQQNYENLLKTSEESHLGGHHSRYGNSENSHEGREPLRKDQAISKTARERHRERTGNSYSQPSASLLSTSAGKPPRIDPTVRQQAVEKPRHYLSHHQSNADENIPMETNDIPSEPVGDQVARMFDTSSHTQFGATSEGYTRNVAEGCRQSRYEYRQTLSGVAYPSDNKYGDPMETGDEPKPLSDDGYHCPDQAERGTYAGSNRLEEEKFPITAAVTPEQIQRQIVIPRTSSRVQPPTNQHQREDAHSPLHSENSMQSEDSLSIFMKDCEIVKVSDTSLPHSDRDSSTRFPPLRTTQL